MPAAPEGVVLCGALRKKIWHRQTNPNPSPACCWLKILISFPGTVLSFSRPLSFSCTWSVLIVRSVSHPAETSLLIPSRKLKIHVFDWYVNHRTVNLYY
jgi:hypothetical protein